MDQTMAASGQYGSIPPPPGWDPGSQAAPWFFGSSFELVLTGACVVMIIEYWRYHSHLDRLPTKILVCVIGVLIILKTMEEQNSAYFRLVRKWGNYEAALFESPWTSNIDVVFNTTITVIVQAFFASRLAALLRGYMRWILVPIIALMLLSLGAGIAMSVQAFFMYDLASLDKFQKFMFAGAIGNIGADLLITGCLCWYLFQSKTGIKKTDNLIGRLIVLAWTTALIPTLDDCIQIALYFIQLNKTLNFLIFAMMKCKLYAISLMVTLNVRSSLRSGDNVHISSQSYQMTRTGKPTATNRIEITTHTDTVHYVDDGSGKRPFPGSDRLGTESGDLEDGGKHHAI